MYPKKIINSEESSGFWAKLSKPFFCLAPMSDVTDIAFRTILAKYGKSDNKSENNIVFWTEFVAADGLCNKLARKKLSHILKYTEAERPIVAQVFGANPENMKNACQYIASLGFDGIDINMGCPDKSVIAQGAGSALIRTPKLAREIIRAALEGVAAAGQHIPVSVKTRIGFNKEEIDTWIPELLQENISALTIHARTKKEMSLVPANWEYLNKVRDLIVKSGKSVLLIGNGDVTSLAEAREKALKYKCDGIMIGRGVFGNPWFFNSRSQGLSLALEGESLATNVFTPRQKIEALKEHIKLFDKELLIPGHKSYAVMKKHFKAYLNGFKGAKEIRNKLMNTDTPHKSITLLNDFRQTLN
jgi:nifR3 family TIM-barrel protein